MGFLRLVDEYKALSAEIPALANEVTELEREARDDLATSAAQFSRDTRQVLDDKLSFTATLMRAGEVDAAKRLLAEVTEDVTTQEAALVEQVNEVRVAQAVRRQKLTRARLLKGLIAAMLGSSIMIMSAMGLAVASMFDDEERPRTALARRGDIPRSNATSAAPQGQLVTVAGVRIRLTQQELRILRDLTTGDVDAGRLHDFLVAVVDDPTLLRQVAAALTAVAPQLEPVTDDAVAVVEQTTDKAERETQAASQKPKDEEPARDDNTDDGNDDEGSSGGTGGGGEGGGPSSGIPIPNEVLEDDDGPLN